MFDIGKNKKVISGIDIKNIPCFFRYYNLSLCADSNCPRIFSFWLLHENCTPFIGYTNHTYHTLRTLICQYKSLTSHEVFTCLSQKTAAIVHFLHRIQKLCGFPLRQGHDVFGIPRRTVLIKSVLRFLYAVPRAFPRGCQKSHIVPGILVPIRWAIGT